MEPLTDVLTLELSFGDEKTIDKDEFLLASPRFVRVDGKNNIYVEDEKHIKVYDPNGRPLDMIGRSGYGPGEFGSPGLVFYYNISPKGYISEYHNGNYINIFNPVRKWVKTFSFKLSAFSEKYKNDNGYTGISLRNFFALEEEHFIYEITGNIDDRKTGDYTIERNVVFAGPDTVLTIVTFKDPGVFRGGGTGSVSYFSWGMLSDESIIYTNSDLENVISETEAEYTLKIFSTQTFETKEITHKYLPERITKEDVDDMTKVWKERWERETRQVVKDVRKESYETVKGIVESFDYHPSIDLLRTDGRYVFVFRRKRNENDEILCDIFDAYKGKYLTSVYFPWRLHFIKNGYAYRTFTPKDGFPVIEKYKIAPAVYGK